MRFNNFPWKSVKTGVTGVSLKNKLGHPSLNQIKSNTKPRTQKRLKINEVGS